MARPNKQGLDYFPLDVGIFENEKILAISGEFSVKGEIITLRLLCEIYQNGYFVEFSELLKNKLARLGGLSGGLVEEVVKKLVKYGFFDESLFSEYNVLTSKNIQKTYLEAVKRRKEIDISQFWLFSGVNVDINPTSSRVNVNINRQSKVNKSKERENTHTHEPQESTHPEMDNETFFLELWKTGREKFLNKPTNIPKLAHYQRQNLEEILKTFSRKELWHGVIGLMEQDLSDLNGGNDMQLNPTHFLQMEHFTKYLTAYQTREQLYVKQKAPMPKSNPKFQIGDV